MTLTGTRLILMLLVFLPAKIYSAIYRVNFGRHSAGPAHLLARILFQLFLIWWTYCATEQKRFDNETAPPKSVLAAGSLFGI
jgi:uncharacterized membrane protein